MFKSAPLFIICHFFYQEYERVQAERTDGRINFYRVLTLCDNCRRYLVAKEYKLNPLAKVTEI